MLYMITIGTRRGSHVVRENKFVESDDPAVAYALGKATCAVGFRPVVQEYVPPVPDVAMSKAGFLAAYGTVAYQDASEKTRYSPVPRYCPSQRGEL